MIFQFYFSNNEYKLSDFLIYQQFELFDINYFEMLLDLFISISQISIIRIICFVNLISIIWSTRIDIINKIDTKKSNNWYWLVNQLTDIS